ncbi:hypothetical protein BKI52_08035 [marine bacterium AO1-C]|nr:hypothetical protein BKI52_08035 [marine bacterium AO1-C]
MLIGIQPICYGFADGQDMAKADRLFNQKKYTESLKIYENIFRTSGKASPSMLLKMAFIYEGLGNYTQTLFCLSLHYEYAPSNTTLLRMEKIAQDRDLKGYEHSDFDYILAIFHRYYIYFNVLMVLIFGSLFGLFIYRLRKRETLPVRQSIAFVLALTGIFILLNFSEDPPKAIIKNDKVFLMSAPSAASEMVDRLDKGHRVEILSKKDIWFKIQIGDKVAYIRESNLIKI